MNKNFTLCCDSADLYAWILQNKDHQHRRLDDLSREVVFKVGEQQICLRFVFKHSTPKLFQELTSDFLLKTAGTPDYILLNEKDNILLCLEDSKTAPVGNAVLQRMDKLFPLLLDKTVRCPVKYIGPLNGMDHSANQMRGWAQSWFYKSFAKYREDIFILLENREDVCATVIEEIEKAMVQELSGVSPSRVLITSGELRALHTAMVATVRTYDGHRFFGKVYKPNGSPAHPVQSTLMVISCLRESLGMSPVLIEAPEEHLYKLQTSSARRIVKALEKGAVLS